ncbi:hypothetical protein ACOZFM_28760 [Streptomyces arboris]|uniref:hypothetical protein n=1 Tax=Streptomyces arboris TaxID=2600619 RepID=UPI003BF4822F
MTDESPLYRMILERWDEAAPFGQTNWWEFHLFQSDLGLYAPFLAEFTAQHPDLHVRPEETDPQEYRQFVIEQYVEWLAREGTGQDGWYGQQQYPQYGQGGEYGQQQYPQGGEYGQQQYPQGGEYGQQQYPQYDQGGEYGQQQYPQYDQGGEYGQQQYAQYDQGGEYGQQQYPQYAQGGEYGQQHPGGGHEAQEDTTDGGRTPQEEEHSPPVDLGAITELTSALAAFTGQTEAGAVVTETQLQLMRSYGLTLEVDLDELPGQAAASTA